MSELDWVIAKVQPPVHGSWSPIDLAAIVAGVQAGDMVGPVPELLHREDGVALVYPGEVHSLAGEPESGKGWIMLAESARLLASGARVLYLDFEDSAASIVTRLLALGAPGGAIVSAFVYVKPEDAIAAGALPALLARGPFALAVIDGLSEAYALLGLDYGSNTDVPTFLQRLVRPIAQAGAATVQIDHVPKDKTNRGRFAIGAQHKLAGVAVAYGVEVIERPSRQHTGRVKLILAKDRHGHIPGQVGSTVAIATITPEDGGARVTVTLGAPDTTDEQGTFRPTLLMERVSRAIEDAPGLTTRSIRSAVKGRNDYVDLALEMLVAEDHVRVEPDGQARRHHVNRPYREDTDTRCAPVPQPCPNRAPGTGDEHRAPVPLPLQGGTGTGHGPNGTPDTPTVPRADDDELTRLEAVVARNADLQGQ